MTRATRKPSRTTVDVVLLDPAWAKALPGVARLVRKAARAATNNRKRSLTIALANDRAELARAYQALDVYVVASRQEGGPKGVLESMASGVPLVTTRVGQAQEIAVDRENALVVDVDDADALADAIVRLRDETLATSLVAAGRTTAERYAYERLDPLWGSLLTRLVERDG